MVWQVLDKIRRNHFVKKINQSGFFLFVVIIQIKIRSTPIDECTHFQNIHQEFFFDLAAAISSCADTIVRLAS